MRLSHLVFVSLFLFPYISLNAAEYNFILKDGKYYIYSEDANGKPIIGNEVTVNIFEITKPDRPDRPDKPPKPNPDPKPTPPTPPKEPTDPFVKQISKLTEQVIKEGGSKTTAAGISSVYSIVADKVLSGEISPDNSLAAIRLATNKILSEQPDKDKWVSFRKSLSDAFVRLQNEGAFSTKEKAYEALKLVSEGMDFVTGFNGSISFPGEVRTSKSAGILGNIDIERLVELIKFIMDLLKLFSGGF